MDNYYMEISNVLILANRAHIHGSLPNRV